MKNNFINSLFVKKINLPDFIIIGAQKSGTTTLHYNLEKHPDIYMANSNIHNNNIEGVKDNEIHFFSNNNNWERSTNWYKQFFPETKLLKGETTPNYIDKFRSHKRMASVVPNTKLILILRNPVDRAYSQWNHFNQTYKYTKNWGWELIDFERAMTENKCFIQSRGHYIDQINSLLNHFSREQLYICFTHDLKNCMSKEMESIYHFLKVRIIKGTYTVKHKRKYNEQIEPAVKRKFLSYYQQYNEKLFEFLGYHIPEWDV